MCDACEISIYIRLAVILACLIGLVISLILEKRNRNKSKPRKYVITSNALGHISYYRDVDFNKLNFAWVEDIRFATAFYDLKLVNHIVMHLKEFYPEVNYMEFK